MKWQIRFFNPVAPGAEYFDADTPDQALLKFREKFPQAVIISIKAIL